MIKIGHRGASGIAPENTRSAFLKAIELGMDMVELDVQLSKDEELIVFHDKDLKRMAGVKRTVNSMDLLDLKALDIGSSFGDEFKGERIMTLKEVIELAKEKLSLNIEIKEMGRKRKLVVKKVIDLLEEEDFKSEVIISSFNKKLLNMARSMDKDISLALIFSSSRVKALKISQELKLQAVHPHHSILTEGKVKGYKGLGLMVNTWTVNDKEKADELCGWGVDGIMTDFPKIFKNEE